MISNEDIKRDHFKIDEQMWTSKAKELMKFIFEHSHTTVGAITEFIDNQYAFTFLKLSYIHNLVQLAEEQMFSFAAVMEIEYFIHSLWDMLIERLFLLENLDLSCQSLQNIVIRKIVYSEEVCMSEHLNLCPHIKFDILYLRSLKDYWEQHKDGIIPKSGVLKA